MAAFFLQTELVLVLAFGIGVWLGGLARCRWHVWSRDRTLAASLQTGPGKTTGPVERALLGVMIEGFLARLGFSVVSFALPFYALSLGMSLTEVGLLAAVRPATSLLAKPLVGRLADRFGIKTVFAVSIALRGLVALLFIAVTSPVMLFAIRGLHGIASAARDPSSAVIIAESADTDKLAQAFSWYSTSKLAGASFGFPLAGFLLTVSGDRYGLVFGMASLLSLVALVAVVWLVPAQRPSLAAEAKTSVVAGEPGAPGARNAAGPSWLRLAGLALMVAIPASMIAGLLPVIATEWSGLSKAQLAVVMTISQVIVVFAGPLLGWVADRVSRGLVLSLRSVANILSSTLYLLFPGFIGFGCAKLADDLGKAGFQPAWGAMMADVARSSHVGARGRVIANLDTASSLGEAVGPLLAGALWQHGGIMWLFGVRMGLAIIAEAYAVWIVRTTSRRQAMLDQQA